MADKAYEVVSRWLEGELKKLDSDNQLKSNDTTYNYIKKSLENKADAYYDDISELIGNDPNWNNVSDDVLFEAGTSRTKLSARDYVQQKAEAKRKADFAPLLENSKWMEMTNDEIAREAEKLGYNWNVLEDRKAFMDALRSGQVGYDRGKILKELEDSGVGKVTSVLAPNAYEYATKAIANGKGSKGELRAAYYGTDLPRNALMAVAPFTRFGGFAAGLGTAALDGAADYASQLAAKGMVEDGNFDVDPARSMASAVAAGTIPTSVTALSFASKLSGKGKKFAEGVNAAITNGDTYAARKAELTEPFKALKDIKRPNSVDVTVKNKQPITSTKDVDKIGKTTGIDRVRFKLINDNDAFRMMEELEATGMKFSTDDKVAAKQVGKLIDDVKANNPHVTEEQAEIVGRYIPEALDLNKGNGWYNAGKAAGRAGQEVFGVAEPIMGGAGINLNALLAGGDIIPKGKPVNTQFLDFLTGNSDIDRQHQMTKKGYESK